ncbi:TolC family protein [Variovorax sp. RHLX14]|uniref:TolC family protein n=1 Tax=Variovorax sp. RHLX14 TaxID=1259731 RepID=UPI003F465488
MKHVSWFVACALAGGTVMGIAANAIAQPAISDPPGVSLREAVDTAWQRAVQSREVASQASRAQADRISASSLSSAAPAFEASHLDDRANSSAGRRESEVGIVWPLWLPGQRDARIAAADADLRLADLGADAARLRIAGAVRESAWKLASAKAEIDAFQMQQRYLRGIADDVQRRVAAGDLARADALAARAELLEAESAEREAVRQLQALQIQWRALTGLAAMPVVALPADVADLAVPMAGDHPELRVAVQAVERARKRVDVVNRSRRDPPELSVKYRQEAPGLGAGTQRGIGVGIRIPFGTDGRNAPLQAAAAGDLDIADIGEQRMRDRLDADLLTARGAVENGARQLEAIRTRAAVLRERAQLIDLSFKAGETPLPELLRAANAAAQADAAFARQQAALGLAHAQLQQASGRLP